MSKSASGNFFEDFSPGQVFSHPTPRTVSQADQALYMALTGTRFALHSSDEFARAIGYPRAPLDDLLVFHLVFGKTVPDVSLNAVANLGYAACVFGAPVYPGDTLSASSRVVGLKETSSGKTGVVYVNSTGVNQRGETVLDYLRWVLVRKREPDTPAPDALVPDLPEAVERDPGRLARFHNEVRIARQIAHPNVCRVYDIAEENGRHFLSMEYVDGEDLGSLLRRIGRLPQDKAMQTAPFGNIFAFEFLSPISVIDSLTAVTKPSFRSPDFTHGMSPP